MCIRDRTKVAPVSKQAQQAALLQSKVEAALQFLDKLGEEGRAQLVQELRAKEHYARMIEELQKLKKSLDEILIAAANDT